MEQQPIQPIETPANRVLVEVRFIDIFRVFLIGVGSGLLIWALQWVLYHWLFSPLMCGSASIDKCDQSAPIAAILAQIVGGIAALIALVRLREFRPLLIVLFAVVTLWNVVAIFASWPIWATIIGMMIVYGLGYALFTILGRVRSLIIAVVLMLICLVITRLVIVS